MTYRPGDYKMICQRTGFVMRRSEAVKDAYGYIVHRDHADPKHPQEQSRAVRIENVPTFISPEPTDTFLGANDVQESDF
jgi:hypothetical protein